jgi:hypothetical protein
MKLRHIAALALAGWYLLIPMFDPKSGKVFNLPLAQWNEEGLFDTAVECAAAKRNLAEDYRKHGASRRVQDIVSKQGECVASDDRRLSGKAPFSLAPPVQSK